LKLVPERTGNTLELIVIGNDFLKRIQMAQQLRERIDKWDYRKEMISKLKRLPAKWDKFFASYTLTGINNQNIQEDQNPNLPQNQ
jgi:hypothetical protein